MRKLLGTLVLLLLIVVGFGLYRGWFAVTTEDQPGQINVDVTIDKQRIREDAEQASEKARKLTGDQKPPTSEQPTSESGSETN